MIWPTRFSGISTIVFLNSELKLIFVAEHLQCKQLIAAAFAACQYRFRRSRYRRRLGSRRPSGFVGFLNHDFRANGLGNAFCRGHMKRPEPRQAEYFQRRWFLFESALWGSSHRYQCRGAAGRFEQPSFLVCGFYLFCTLF